MATRRGKGSANDHDDDDHDDDDDSERRKRTTALALAEGWPTIAEAAEQFDLPASTLRRWASTGKVSAEMQGSRYVVNPQEVAAMAGRDERIQRLSSDEEGAGSSGHVQPRTAALISGVVELLTTTSNQTKTQLAHNEHILNLTLKSIPDLTGGYREQAAFLREVNKDLAAENKELRAELKAYHEQQKTDRIKEKELEIKKINVEKGWSTVQGMAPSVLALIGANAKPQDPTATDKSIATWLQSVTEEQARKLHSTGLLTDAQAMEAVTMRTSGKAAPGQLSAWLRSFSGEQLAKVLASGILDKDQSLQLAANHEAAGKLAASAVATATTAPPATTTAPATTTTTQSTTAPQVRGLVLLVEEVAAVRELVGAVVEAPDEVSSKIFATLGPDKVTALTKIDWSRRYDP